MPAVSAAKAPCPHGHSRITIHWVPRLSPVAAAAKAAYSAATENAVDFTASDPPARQRQ